MGIGLGAGLGAGGAGASTTGVTGGLTAVEWAAQPVMSGVKG